MNDRDQYDLWSENTYLLFTHQRFEMPAPVVVYADFESASDDKNRHKPIMLSCLVVSRIPAIQTQLRFFHAPHEEESDLGPFQGLLDSIPRKREEAPLRRITPQEHFWDRERLSIYACVSILSQETGGRQGETSHTCVRWIHHREWRDMQLQSRAVHLHLLHQV